jgi:hypothetical protein
MCCEAQRDLVARANLHQRNRPARLTESEF